MSDWVPALVSAALAGLLAPGMLRTLRAAGWVRENFRQRSVVVPAGVVALIAGVLALGVLAAVDVIFGTDTLRRTGIEGAYFNRSVDPENYGWTAYAPLVPGSAALSAAPLALGVGLLGLLDDKLDGAPRGWRGHGAALRRGELSTGALKAIGTAAMAAWVFAGEGFDGWNWALAVVLLALVTNLFNLLDLRPGRATKVWVVLAAALVVAGEDGVLRAVGVWGGALVVLGLGWDLRERAMLGDTGANVLGALAGYWLVHALDSDGQLIALAVVVALTVYGELASFTQTIERVPPLRWLDALGRPR